jgi:hypothetical protein
MAERLTAETVIRSMSAGNGRGNVLKSPDELLRRLAEDGVEVDRSELLPILSDLLKRGVIERRPDVGIWLSSGVRSVWLEDQVAEPVGDPESAAWGRMAASVRGRGSGS